MPKAGAELKEIDKKLAKKIEDEKGLGILDKIMKSGKEILSNPQEFIQNTETALRILRQRDEVILYANDLAYKIPFAIFTVLLAYSALSLLTKYREDPVLKLNDQPLEDTLNSMIYEINKISYLLNKEMDDGNTQLAHELAEAIIRYSPALDLIAEEIKKKLEI